MTAATHMSAAKPGVSASAPSVAAATVTSAMLRPQRDYKEKRNRRDGHQTPHTQPLYARIARNFDLIISKACRSFNIPVTS